MNPDITLLLSRSAQGDRLAVSQLMPMLYEELRRVARDQIRKERSDHTLQGTALVNEAYLVLSQGNAKSWTDRQHFFRLASQVMRHILVDHARAKIAEKRGGDVHITSLNKTSLDFSNRCVKQIYPDALEEDAAARVELDFLALDSALTSLRERSPRQAQIVDLRFFGGLSIEDAALAMEISPATLKREWTMAKLFLKAQLKEDGVAHGD
jgi:RNA polymerase sigma-70 factor, ECF subfamily